MAPPHPDTFCSTSKLATESAGGSLREAPIIGLIVVPSASGSHPRRCRWDGHHTGRLTATSIIAVTPSGPCLGMGDFKGPRRVFETTLGDGAPSPVATAN